MGIAQKRYFLHMGMDGIGVLFSADWVVGKKNRSDEMR
jgi:hypothetical protein